MRRAFFGRFVSWLSAAWVVGSLRNSQAQSGGRVSGFDHVAVPLRDERAMTRFYRALGFQVNEGERTISVHFRDNKINFHRSAFWQSEEFTLRAPSAQPPCGDFCFVWDGSEGSLATTLQRAGAEIIVGPVIRQGGRDSGAAEGTSRYIRDPDGNLLEFIIY